MNHTHEDVLAIIHRLFPETEVPMIMQILGRYGTEASEPERDRVQRAILMLSEGRRSKLQHYVEAAKRDYRDVIYWSESAAQLAASVLEVLRTNWSWTLSDACRVLAQNSFGNVLVELSDASIWRVCPEDLAASRMARSAAKIAELRTNQEFQTDRTVDGWVEAAETTLGPLHEGQYYGFKICPVLGGAYDVENMAIKSILEWLAVSGDVGRKVQELPSGTQIRLEVRDP